MALWVCTAVFGGARSWPGCRCGRLPSAGLRLVSALAGTGLAGSGGGPGCTVSPGLRVPGADVGSSRCGSASPWLVLRGSSAATRLCLCNRCRQLPWRGGGGWRAWVSPAGRPPLQVSAASSVL